MSGEVLGFRGSEIFVFGGFRGLGIAGSCKFGFRGMGFGVRVSFGFQKPQDPATPSPKP